MTTAPGEYANGAEINHTDTSPMSQDHLAPGIAPGATNASRVLELQDVPNVPVTPAAAYSDNATGSVNPHPASAPHGQGHGHGHLGHDLAHKIFAASVPGTEITKQISYIAPGQTAKALMLIYLTFSVPIVLLAIVVGFFRYRGQIELSAMFSTVFSALIVNAVVGFVLLWIACQAYNWVASRFGGIEIVLSDAPEDV